MIRIDAMWLAADPIDMRAGAERLLSRVVQVFGAAQAHHGYLFANARGTRVKLLVHDGFGVWCAARRLNVAALRQARWLLREPGSGTRMACAAHFESLGFRPHVRLELGSNEAIKQAVAAGLGLAVLSRHAIEHGAGDDRLKVLRVRGFPAQSSWYLLHSRARRLSPVASEFLERAAAARAPLAKDSRPKLAKA